MGVKRTNDTEAKLNNTITEARIKTNLKTLKASNDEVIKKFFNAQSMDTLLDSYMDLVKILKNDAPNAQGMFNRLKCVYYDNWRVKPFIKLIDNKINNGDYIWRNKNDYKLLIVGAGPVGLRMAIETALMGIKTQIAEKRRNFSRNNAVSLWRFVDEDLKSLGIKCILKQFCNTSFKCVSIRKLQLAMLKICLLLGVDFYRGVSVDSLKEPDDSCGWRVNLSPQIDDIHDTDYDMIVLADGKLHAELGFEYTKHTSKTAIGISANLNPSQERDTTSQGGKMAIYDQKKFNGLETTCDIKIENFVHYSDTNHHIVMTPSKKSLLSRGVVHSDHEDVQMMLRNDNIDKEQLKDFAYDAIRYMTSIYKINFMSTDSGVEDVNIFDFSQSYKAAMCSLQKIKHNKSVVLTLIGDALITPFWPAGTGCAKGFLSVYDTAWMIDNILKGNKEDAISWREQVYVYLKELKPDDLKDFNTFRHNPWSRYKHCALSPPYSLPFKRRSFASPAIKDDSSIYDIALRKRGEGLKRNHSLSEQESHKKERIML